MKNPQVGDYCLGGIGVFYVDELGKNGLISLSQDEGLMSWSEGLSHSENLILHGYDDWFLPSIYQLEVLYENIGPNSIFEFNFAEIIIGLPLEDSMLSGYTLFQVVLR